MPQVAATIPTVEIIDIGKATIREEALASNAVASRLDQFFIRAVRILETFIARIMKFGIGRLGLNTKKISTKLFSTGTPNFFIHPKEAIQGDLDRNMASLFHPGGSLGRKLLPRVKGVTLDHDLPLLNPDANLEDVIFQMSRSEIAIAIIHDNFKPFGIITDSDLRRVFKSKVIEIHKVKAYEIMTKTPNFIRDDLILRETEAYNRKKPMQGTYRTCSGQSYCWTLRTGSF